MQSMKFETEVVLVSEGHFTKKNFTLPGISGLDFQYVHQNYYCFHAVIIYLETGTHADTLSDAGL